MAARGGVNAKGENAPQPVKVQRYWPGKAPKGVTEYSSSEEEEEEQFERQKETDLVSSVQKVEITEQEAISDRRLRRLKEAKEAKEASTQAIDRRRRRIEEDEDEKEDVQKDQLHVIEVLQEVELDDDAEIRRRQLKRDRALEIRRHEEERLKALEEEERAQTTRAEEEEEESDSEESSEYESDSEEEETPRKLLKPVFIPKAHRETVLEKERMEKLEEEAELKRLQELEERKKESHAMVAEHVQRALEKEVNEDTGLQEVDDTDGLDEQAEYEEWKLRELRRIKRDKEERVEREKEREEIERKRNMSEEERMKEDMERIRKQHEEKPKSQYKFLQKYYHKGAFYLNDDQILKRDYTTSTPDEVAHREILPKVMQVKNFGRAGQTKWTHLTDQDTSTKDAPWNAKTEINKRTLSKLGGLHGGFDKPTAKKRKS